MGSDEREIRELVERWMSASREGDTATVLGLMTEDVVFLGAGRPPMIGREAFAAASAGQPAFEISGTSEIQEVRVSGEWAWMWTRLTVVMTPRDGGRPVRREGHTLSVLRKEEGKWRLARDANMLAVVPDGRIEK
jgi:uncharacterized protein (TIGR02246 family)